MTTNTMVALGTAVGTGSSGTLTFTGISSNYTDLFISFSGAVTSGSSELRMNFNGDSSGTNGSSGHYSWIRVFGTGSTAGSDGTSGSNTNYTCIRAGEISTTSLVATFDVMNYANTTTYKTTLWRNRSTDGTNTAGADLGVSLWRGSTGSSKDAITSITISASANFTSTTTATIYGIANADIGAYATGGVITQDANYYYHAFGNSSYFTPTRNLTADILVVAGGGGGYAGYGGGGGAGGLRAFSSQSLTNGTAYTCTIGAGGPGVPWGGTSGSSYVGGNSSFGSIGTASGGAAGGNNEASAVTNGGSGGGAGGSGSSNYSGTAGNAGSYSPVEGYAGGNSVASSTGFVGSAGGGGGAGGAGTTGTSTQKGNGGVGSSTYSSWLATTGLGVLNSSDGLRYIAGGGGGGIYSGTTIGGAGGLGGGGTGGVVTSTSAFGTAGLATTGSGGGAGGGPTGNGLSGGSGLIIVRYAK